MKTATPHPHGPQPNTFDELNAAHQLRPIRDAAEYDSAAAMAGRLAVLDTRTRDQDDYLETLAELIGKYDDEHHAKDLSHVTPLDALRHLCERNGVNASRLGELLGDPSLGSAILRGERPLSKRHIRILCDRFRVRADLFLD